ncbi:hypothetical protein FQN57_003986 [Myotisia sp. PD_48]|nr:hypothetical protein FQN57_003986 [Myotisia sp. PD_48]
MASVLSLPAVGALARSNGRDSEPTHLPVLKKRKLFNAEENLVHELPFTKLVLRPYGNSPPGNPQTFSPVTLLPRSRLPMSWIDISPDRPGVLRPGEVFISDIPALECTRRRGQVVLVARLDSVTEQNGEYYHQYYAVERVKSHLYSACPLANWLEEADLLVAAKFWAHDDPSEANLNHDIDACSSPNSSGINWLDNTLIPDLDNYAKTVIHSPSLVSLEFERSNQESDNPSERYCSPSLLENLPTHSDIFESSAPTESKVLNSPTYGKGDEGNPLDNISVDIVTSHDTIENFVSLQDPEEFFWTLKNQYLETLYTSKTSVAYFVKGPLSRARSYSQAAGNSSSMNPSVLFHFYRSCILPMKKMDVKYRSTLPEIVRNLSSYSAEENVHSSRKTFKVRKKNKLGKNGLYPGEEDLVLQWWKLSSINELSGNRSVESELKHLFEEIRMREALLQILLTLETMLLEGVVENVDNLQRPAAGGAERPTKSKKNLKNSIWTSFELLLDRVCIWNICDSAVLSHEISGGSHDESTSKRRSYNDKLRDFCTEVIIPFYSTRLPEECEIINRKFGGPVAASPHRSSKPRTKRAANESKLSKGPVSAISKTSLYRVNSDGNSIPKMKAPPLFRANTTPQIKKEPDEHILLPPSINGRGGIQKPNRVNNREVDLQAVAKQHESKMKKMNTFLEQKRELDAAISAMRKPNRELVSRDFVEGIEKRSSRKQKNPTRNPFGQGVQVMATPKGRRTKDFNVVDLPAIPNALQGRKLTGNPLTPRALDTQAVPSSMKLRNDKATLIHETPSKRGANAIDQEMSPTLLRKPKTHINFSKPARKLNLSTAVAVTETPPGLQSMVYSASQEANPKPPSFVAPSTPNRSHCAVVSSTPLPKPGPPKTNSVNETPKKSDMKGLGWLNNDYDDEDELAYL